MIDHSSSLAARDDAGAALHHWLLAVLLGAVFGGVAVMAAWIVMRALF